MPRNNQQIITTLNSTINGPSVLVRLVTGLSNASLHENTSSKDIKKNVFFLENFPHFSPINRRKSEIFVGIQRTSLLNHLWHTDSSFHCCYATLNHWYHRNKLMQSNDRSQLNMHIQNKFIVTMLCVWVCEECPRNLQKCGNKNMDDCIAVGLRVKVIKLWMYVSEWVCENTNKCARKGGKASAPA